VRLARPNCKPTVCLLGLVQALGLPRGISYRLCF
jgi:hypothetical protein